ncbi:MAG: DEAD/DEAH box helicase [archaeon]|nr:MAG: DEAD/DEAH box helicase [archaeon]
MKLMKFRNLKIEKDILKLIEKKGFDEPTIIQARAIPRILEGKDVIAGSATGSGKTLAFVVGLLHNHRDSTGEVQGLVLAPTRELAQQVSRELSYFCGSRGYNVACVYGGVAIEPQFRSLEKADFVVATPGRLLDHLGRGSVDLSKVNTLILDEADRMLDMGFIDDVERIIRKTPAKRQTILTSATMRGEVMRLSQRYMHNPVKVFGKKEVDPSKLKQVYYDIPRNRKLSLLTYLLKKEKSDLTMVFCNSRRAVDFVTRNLQNHGINTHAIHGGFSQKQRDSAMNKFKSENVRVLVCTDVAARGLDIENISHVYNYDIPRESKQYMHRIGRTARAGEEGKAINILSGEQHEDFRRVIRDNGVRVDKVKTPELKTSRFPGGSQRIDRHRGRERRLK